MVDQLAPQVPAHVATVESLKERGQIGWNVKLVPSGNFFLATLPYFVSDVVDRSWRISWLADRMFRDITEDHGGTVTDRDETVNGLVEALDEAGDVVVDLAETVRKLFKFNGGGAS